MPNSDADLLYLFNRDFGQNLFIDEALEQTGQVDRAMRGVAQDLRGLRERIDHMALFLAAAVALLQEKAGVTRDELMAKVRQLDLADGAADGKVRVVAKCAHCGAVMDQRHRRCVWCGQDKLETKGIDGIF